MEREEALERIDKVMLDLPDSRGFIVFVGVITDEEDKNGNKMIKFSYERNKFGFEDAAKAIKSFRSHIHHDMESR